MYGTLAQLKSEVSVTDTNSDTYLTDLLTAASGWIDTYTNQPFSGNDITVTDELYQGRGAIFYLRRTGIKTVSSIKVKYWQGDTYTTLDPAQYEWNQYGRIVLYVYPDPFGYGGGSFATGTALYQGIPQFVQVTYLYNSGAVPAEISRVAVQIAARMYRLRGDRNVQLEKIGDYEVRYQQFGLNAIDDFAGVLDAYRVPTI